MAAIEQIRVESYGIPYGIPGDEIAPEDSPPELDDCGAGLSEDSLLHWPRIEPR